MQLTRAADYAVRVMVHLATLPAENRVFLPDLAEATAAPESFLSKVLQALVRAELISFADAGSWAALPSLPRGREATMREVIEAIDGPICLNVCLNGGKECERKSWCPAHPVWARAQRAMLDVLMSVTVSAMASRGEPHATTRNCFQLYPSMKTRRLNRILPVSKHPAFAKRALAVRSTSAHR